MQRFSGLTAHLLTGLFLLIGLSYSYSQPADSKTYESLVKARNQLNANSLPAERLNLKGRFADFYRLNGLDTLARQSYAEILGEKDSLTTDSLLGSVYSGLATILFNQKLYSKAYSYDSLALQAYNHLGNKALSGWAYLRISRIQFNQNQHSSAVNTLLRKCLPLFTSAGDFSGRIACFDGLGMNYLALGRTSEAKWFYIQENLLAKKIRDNPAVAASLTGLGKVKSRLGDYKAALADLTNALSIAGESGSKEELRNAYLGLGTFYSLTGSNTRSKNANAKAGQYAAEIASTKKERALSALHIRDSIENAGTTITVTQNKTKMQTRGSSVPFLLIVIFISIALAVILFVKFLRNRRKF